MNKAHLEKLLYTKGGILAKAGDWMSRECRTWRKDQVKGTSEIWWTGPPVAALRSLVAPELSDVGLGSRESRIIRSGEQGRLTPRPVRTSVFSAGHFHIAGATQGIIHRINRRITRRVSELFIIHHPVRPVRRSPVMKTHNVPHDLTTTPIASASRCNDLRSEQKDSLRWHTCDRDLQEIACLKRGPQSTKEKTGRMCRVYHS
jgi:hypothetical protein